MYYRVRISSKNVLNPPHKQQARAFLHECHKAYLICLTLVLQNVLEWPKKLKQREAKWEERDRDGWGEEKSALDKGMFRIVWALTFGWRRYARTYCSSAVSILVWSIFFIRQYFLLGFIRKNPVLLDPTKPIICPFNRFKNVERIKPYLQGSIKSPINKRLWDPRSSSKEDIPHLKQSKDDIRQLIREHKNNWTKETTVGWVPKMHKRDPIKIIHFASALLERCEVLPREPENATHHQSLSFAR